jgi:signal transduction histidine kinase
MNPEARQVDALRASRKRLVLAADEDRRRLERELHDGVQQQLVALAVNLQRAAELVGAEPAAARSLLVTMAQDVQRALDAAAELASRIYPPLLEAGGLAPALRSAAGRAGVRARIDAARDAASPSELVAVVYRCCEDILERAAADTEVAVTVRKEEGALVFEVVATYAHEDSALLPVRDRIEALGGHLTIEAAAGREVRVAGSLPLSG